MRSGTREGEAAGSGLATGWVCLFAKPPRPGEVKTRLCGQGIDPALAAELATAFLLDAWAGLAALPWARRALASTAAMPPDLGLDDAPLWLQGAGDLGARIERIMRRALTQGDLAIAIGADSPGLPRRLLDAARAALETHDAVLGPSDDGGFYLLGLRRCPEGLLDALPWSAATTFARTHARLVDRGLRVATLTSWFDVDRPEDLARLRRALATSGPEVAPRTAALLARLAPTLPALKGPP